MGAARGGMKRLFLIRHAKSSWDDTALADRERPLNERGKRDAPKIGERLASADMVALPKPAPDVYLHAASLLGVAPERCLVVEDSSTGTRAMRAARMAPVIAATLLTMVSGRPSGDVWLGLPFFFCAVLQGLAAFVAIRHFMRHRGSPTTAAAAP